jgi:hypothetical protein
VLELQRRVFPGSTRIPGQQTDRTDRQTDMAGALPLLIAMSGSVWQALADGHVDRHTDTRKTGSHSGVGTIAFAQ